MPCRSIKTLIFPGFSNVTNGEPLELDTSRRDVFSKPAGIHVIPA
jgi:hypothetical protein